MVLISTLSFSIEKHFCGNHLVAVAVFHKVEKCVMAKHFTSSTLKKCCKEEIEVIQGQDELKITTVNDFQTPLALVLNPASDFYCRFFVSLPKQIIPHKNYSPPDLIINRQLLESTFLI